MTMKNYYHNFRLFTHTADYPHRLIFAKGEKRISRLPALADNPHTKQKKVYAN